MSTRRAVELMALLVASVVGIFAPAGVEATSIGLRNGGMTEASAATFTYDGSAVVHVDAYAGGGSWSRSAQFNGAEVALPHRSRAWDTSTTPAAALNATEAASELPGLSSSAAQLEAKFKHAADFGVLESRGASGFEAFGKAVDSFVGDSATVRVMGTYRGSPAILNYNPATAQVVVQTTDGAFVSGWQMSPAQLQNVITKASLGGG